jgi:hypothetical protein
MADLVFELVPTSAAGDYWRFNLQPEYSRSAFSLEVGMRQADKLFGGGMSSEGRLHSVLHLRWDVRAVSAVRWISAMQEYGHGLDRLIGMEIEDVPLASAMRNIDDWIAYFEAPYERESHRRMPAQESRMPTRTNLRASTRRR